MRRVVALLLVALVLVLWFRPGGGSDLEQRCEARGGEVVSYGPTGEDCVVDGRFVRP